MYIFLTQYLNIFFFGKFNNLELCSRTIYTFFHSYSISIYLKFANLGGGYNNPPFVLHYFELHAVHTSLVRQRRKTQKSTIKEVISTGL